VKKIAALVLLLAAVGVGAWFSLCCKTAPDGDPILYGNVEVRQVNLAFNVEGRLVEMLVEEGDRVTAGQVMARMDGGQYQDAVRLAEARLEVQGAQLAKLEAGSRPEEIDQAAAEVAQAEAAAINARATFERVDVLAKQKDASQQALDNARAALHQAEARLVQARKAHALAVIGPREEDLEAARAQSRADEAALSIARRRLADTELRAPSDGIVQTRIHEPGAVLLPNSAVYTLALVEPVWVRAFVDEPRLGLVRPGMKAEVVTDTAPDKPFIGQVGFISPVAEFTPKTVETPELRTGLVYRLRVVVDGAGEGLRQGMPVTVRLRP
jgi:HlyD family secretion protein